MKYSMRYRVANLAKKLGVGIDAQKSPELMAMQKEISALPDGIQFRITTEPNGDWMAESINLDGILTGGSSGDKVDEMIKDAIFTYYGVAPEYCDDALLRSSMEPVTTKQAMYATA